MKKINWLKYRFRASSVFNLMIEPRSKKEEISQTTKSFLKLIFLEEVWDRKYTISNKYIEKGNYAEEDSLTLLSRVREKIFFKNKTQLENEYITGTPDIILPKKIIDIKTCWDMKTFLEKEKIENNYKFQLLSYMWLTGKKKAELVFTLVNAPEHLIVAEKTKRLYQLGSDSSSPEWNEEENRIDRLMVFDDVPEKKKIKTFKLNFEKKEIENMVEKIEKARFFLKKLKF